MAERKPRKLAVGELVAVQFGLQQRRGVVVGTTDHPAFGPLVDVRSEDGETSRYVADRVTRDRTGRGERSRGSPRSAE